MRPLFCIIAALAVLAGCAPEATPHPPPTDAFYFPTGIAHAGVSGSANGVLAVASSNFDKRYDRGSLTLVRLDDLPDLPTMGSVPDAGKPVQITDLHLDTNSQVEIQSLAGEVAVNAGFVTDAGTFIQRQEGPRFYVTSRDESGSLQWADVTTTGLHCPYADPSASNPRDCFSKAPSLLANEKTETGLPRAPAPYGLGIFVPPDKPDQAELYVTHLQTADTPAGSGKETHAYLVKTNAEDPQINDGSFLPIENNAANSVAVTDRWIFLTGRFFNDTSGGDLLRFVQRDNPSVIVSANLQGQFYSLEARGLAIHPTGNPDVVRVLVVGRSPDALLVADVKGLLGGNPQASVVRVLPLSLQPNEVKLVERPGTAPLAVISCTGAGIVAIYDDEVGKIVAQVPGVGQQPYSLAVDNRGTSARVFASNFGDGRVAVIDIPDVGKPFAARLVAHLGKEQTCITKEDDPSCVRVAQ